MAADAPNLNDIIATAQATTLDALGKGFASQMTRQAIIADRKFDELDVEQSIANRYATAGVPNENTAAIK